MADELQPATPPQDTGMPDAVERDGLAIGSAEDLDEDRMRVDPLEAGRDPSERWMGADRYGVTPYEQSHPRPLAERMAEEQPDPTANLGTGVETPPAQARPVEDDEPLPDEGVADDVVSVDPEDDADAEILREATSRGQAADEAGGSVAGAARTPPPPE